MASIIRDAKQTRARFDVWWATKQPEIADQLRQRADDMQRDAGPRVGRPRLDIAVYAETAAVYESAIHTGRDPTKAVAEHFHVARSTAGTRVRRSREFGFLPPTTRGRAGGVRPESEGNSDV